MKFKYNVKLLIVFYLNFSCYLFAQKSHFYYDSECWSVIGDASGPTYFSTGGNPDGGIQGTDLNSGIAWYFLAPPSFLGNKYPSLGKYIRYDIKTTRPGSSTHDLVISGNGMTIHYDVPITVGTTWQHVDVLMDYMGWRHVVSSGIGPPVSPADFILIISGITSIKVLGEFSNQLDIGSLDNFILEPMSTVSYLPSLICANSFVNFEDQSVISATSWFWNLPGSSTPVSYDQNPENITYSSGGNYPSSLIVSNGCITDTILFNVSVRNEIFSNVNIELCFGDTYILPDGSVATISGIYQSNFIAVSGCDSTINTTVNIHELNNVANDTSICSGSNLYLPWGLVTSSDGTYNHTYLNSMGCDSIVTFNLTVLPELTDSFSVENVSCFEQSDGAISVFIQGGTPPFSYYIGSSEFPDGVIDGLKAGTYLCVIRDASGCYISQNISINEPEQIIVSVLSSDHILNPYEELSLVASSNNPNASYLWSPSEVFSCDTCAFTEFSSDSTTEYTLTAGVLINGNMCYAETRDIIKINSTLYVPTAFTPNGDGINEEFGAFGKNIIIDTMRIFNRWGEVVFQTSTFDEKWNGNEPEGVYTYTIEYTDSKGDTQKLEGRVTLIR